MAKQWPSQRMYRYCGLMCVGSDRYMLLPPDVFNGSEGPAIKSLGFPVVYLSQSGKG